MEFVKLGNTGVDISRLCLGCMTFGVPERGAHPWTLDEEKSIPILRQAVEAGINFFDTANSYSDGTSEEIIGRALRESTRRDEIVVATKVYFPSDLSQSKTFPNRSGLSRKAILAGIDDSLRRLAMDYVDLYQIHRFDYGTPLEETLEALHDVVKSGKARYIGASSMFAWQFAKALYVSRANGWTAFISMQDHLNLLNREEEREMLPLCRDQRIAVLPWSPLARGRLTRDFEATSDRQETDAVGKKLYAATAGSDRLVIERVAEVAKARAVPRAQVALAWVLQKSGVTAPIVGASKPQHLDDAVAAMTLKLTGDEIATLESAYVPHPVVGFE